MQLAKALTAKASGAYTAVAGYVFVCADLELNAAARLEGLVVEDPNQRPSPND